GLEPRGQTDEDDADVHGHCHRHAPQDLQLVLLAAALVLLDGPVNLLEPADLAHALDEPRDLGPEARLDLAQRDSARRAEQHGRHLGGRIQFERLQDPERAHGVAQHPEVGLVAATQAVAHELDRRRNFGVLGAGRRPIRRGGARKFRIGQLGRLHCSIIGGRPGAGDGEPPRRPLLAGGYHLPPCGPSSDEKRRARRRIPACSRSCARPGTSSITWTMPGGHGWWTWPAGSSMPSGSSARPASRWTTRSAGRSRCWRACRSWNSACGPTRTSSTSSCTPTGSWSTGPAWTPPASSTNPATSCPAKRWTSDPWCWPGRTSSRTVSIPGPAWSSTSSSTSSTRRAAKPTASRSAPRPVPRAGRASSSARM